MSRIQTQLKIHELKGPRLPYKPEEAEIRENDYKYLAASGIAADDGEGILYWIQTVVTSDGGSSRAYDNNAASGETLDGDYEAKAVKGVPHNFDPPIPYYHGIYVNLTNAVARICFRPINRNLRCRVSPMHSAHERALVCRLISRKVTSRSLIARVSPKPFTSRALVCRVRPTNCPGSRALVTRVTSRKVTGKDLVARTLVTNVPRTNNLVCRVNVYYIPATKDLVCQATIRKVTGTSLVCHLYADRTE